MIADKTNPFIENFSKKSIGFYLIRKSIEVYLNG